MVLLVSTWCSVFEEFQWVRALERDTIEGKISEKNLAFQTTFSLSQSIPLALNERKSSRGVIFLGDQPECTPYKMTFSLFLCHIWRSLKKPKSRNREQEAGSKKWGVGTRD